MAGSWSEAEAIKAGLYDPIGSSGAAALAKQNSSFTGRGTASDLFQGPTIAGVSNNVAGVASSPWAFDNSGYLSGLDQYSPGDSSGSAGAIAGANGIGANGGVAVGGASGKNGGNGAALGAWLVRFTVIGLGVVFVGVGLTMFRPTQTIMKAVTP